MIVSFLKMHPKLQSKEIRGYDNLGVLLMEFFELYGKYFNYEIVGLGVTETDAWYYRKKDYGFEDYGSAEKLSIADPHDRCNQI